LSGFVVIVKINTQIRRGVMIFLIQPQLSVFFMWNW